MQEQNELFKGLLGDAAKRYSDDSKKSKDAAGDPILPFILLAILLFVGAEILKIVFRTNFGSRAISLLRIGIACMVLFLWAAISVAVSFDWDLGIDAMREFGLFGGRIGAVITALFYVSLSIFVITVGAAERAKSKQGDQHPYYRGDSVILGFLMKKGWSQKKVQELGEPLAAFAAGVFLIAVNPFLGFPIFFCAISLVLNNIFENVFGTGESQVRQVINQKGYQKDDFSQIVS